MAVNRVFYKKKNEIQLKKLEIEGEGIPALKLMYKIGFQESIDKSLHILLYNNKTGEAVKEHDNIPLNSIIEYSTIPLNQMPPSMPPPAPMPQKP